MKECSCCQHQELREKQNKIDMARIKDILLMLESFDWNETRRLLKEFRGFLIVRNEEIAGRT